MIAHNQEIGAAISQCGGNHWNSHALQWKWLTSPLRPSPEDIVEYERLQNTWSHPIGNASVNALLLGVTPEIVTMNWPAGTVLRACDRSAAMIQEVWPTPNHGIDAVALCADWDDLPLDNSSQDIVIGDGCMNILAFPDKVGFFLESIHRVMRDGGMLLLRVFCRPNIPETPNDVFEAVGKGSVGNPHILKWRLAMSLHGNLSQGVRLGDIWNAWNGAFPSPETLAEGLGWRVEEVKTIDAYKGVDTRYIFPTFSEAQKLIEGHFTVVEHTMPTYELGERCPIFAARKRGRT